MAISHIQPLLILLASLFFLPASQAVDFTDCSDDTFTITSVDVIVDQHETNYNISGSTSIAITKGYARIHVSIGHSTAVYETRDLCKLMACPVSSGAFVLSIDKIPHRPGNDFRAQIVAYTGSEGMLCARFEYNLESSVDVASVQ